MFAKPSKTFLKNNFLKFSLSLCFAGLFGFLGFAWAYHAQPLTFHLGELSDRPLPPEKMFDADTIVQSKLLTVNFVRFRGHLKPHWHEKRMEVVVSLSDGGVLTVKKVDHPLKIGSLFFIPRRAIHEARCPETQICRAYSIFVPRWNPDKPDRIFVKP